MVLIEPEEYQALGEKEESDLERMMSELGFTANNAEEFVEKLTNQLSILDGVSKATYVVLVKWQVLEMVADILV